ncbi:TPA: divalent-cation tolerance protein CutA [Candidatus Bathyarchaeota archaeon]|nr:divalent-cation tolerance protein CutA [Candidatus Bathyarchaeota archaeon]
MYTMVFVTCKDEEEAKKIARAMVSKRLAACATIIKNAKSFYWWRGKIEGTEENLIIIKSKINLLGKLIKEIRFLHSYEIPEIVALPMTGGLKDYFKWIDEETLEE